VLSLAASRAAEVASLQAKCQEQMAASRTVWLS